MLTNTIIRNLQAAPPKIKKLSDGGGSGLHILCHPSGRKVFAVRYTHPVTRKEQTLTIGEYPHVSLKMAREHAEKAHGLRVLGVDPREAKKREEEASRAAAEDTFEQLGSEWIKVRGARWSENYRHKIMSMLNRHLYPTIGKTPITLISAPTLLSLLRPIEEYGKTDLAHTLLQQTGAIFRFAISTGRAVNDPASALRGALAPHREKNFNAITTPEELSELLRAMDSYQGEYTTKSALEFTLLTFQRSQSIRLAKWEQIDWNNKLWRIPADIMKMKEPHLVPLSAQALDLLRVLEPLSRHSEYIFPCLFSRSKPISENTMLYALVRLGYRGRMTVHGFRSTASTLLNENGHHPDVIEAALAHVRGDIRSIYNRAKYLPERVKLYQWWADYVDSLRTPTTQNLELC
jgi:integrase